MQKHKPEKPPFEQPELPNMPPKPVKIEKVYKIDVIIGKKKTYCKVDYQPEPELTQEQAHEKTAEIFGVVRQLETILNKLAKHNLQINLAKYEQHYNTTDIHSSHPGN